MQQTITNRSTDRTMKKITFGAIVLALLGIAAVLTLSGCVGTEVIEKTETKTDGTVITTKTTKTNNSVLTEKTVATAGSTSAVKLESSGSTSSGTITPNFLVGSGTGSVSTCPQKNNKVTIGMSWSAGILSSITNASASSGSFTYIGNDGESAEETQTRLNAIVNLKQKMTGSSDDDSSTSATTDSSSSDSSSTSLTSVTITADTTAESGYLYVIDASAGAVTLKMPTGMTSDISFGYSVTDATKGATLALNGNTLDSKTADLTLAKGNAATLTYSTSTSAWTSTTTTSE